MNNNKYITSKIKTLLTGVFYFLTGFLTLQAQQYRVNFIEELLSKDLGPDSAITYLNKLQEEATLAKDTAQIIKCLVSKSTFNRVNYNYTGAFNNAGEALFLSEELQDPLLLAKSHEEFGVLNFIFKQIEQSGTHFKKSYTYYKDAFKQNLIPAPDLFHSYYYLMLYYRKKHNEEYSKAYLDSSYSILNSTNLDPIYNVYLDTEKAAFLSSGNQLNKAMSLLKTSAKQLENYQPTSTITSYHKRYQVVVYNSIAKIYQTKNETDSATYYFQKAIDSPILDGEKVFYTSFVYELYASHLYDQNDYKGAYDLLKKSKTINDTYLNPMRNTTQGFLTVKNRYSEELIRKNEELGRKNLELANQKQKTLQLRIILSLVVFLILLSALVYRNRIQNLKHEKENETSRKKQQESKEIIEQKNKELTATMLQLIEKEEIIKTLSSHLEKSPEKKSTTALLNSINKSSVSLWDQFNSRFMSLNEGFYERLQTKVPDLSPGDLKICALIKLNFTGKEMAHLLGISQGSVHVARHRLRKKINLDREVSLAKFINSI